MAGFPMAEKLVLCLAAALALAGCDVAPRTNYTTTLVNVPTRAAPAANPPVIQQQKAAPSGKRQEVEFLSAVNPDCSPAGSLTVQIASNPVHGTAAVDDVSQFGTWAPNNPRAHCNTQRVAGTGVFYQSAPGYRGSDSLVVGVIGPTGQHFNVMLNIMVQ